MSDPGHPDIDYVETVREWKILIREKDKLITELADALEDVDGWPDRDDQPLIDRARKAVT